MKLFLPLLFLFLLSCSEPEVVSKPNPEYQFNWKKLNLRGKPESVREVNLKQFVPDSLISEVTTHSNYFFDEEGNVTREEAFIDNEGHPNKNEFEYDQYGNIVKIEHYDAKSIFTRQTRYVFDSVGNVKEILNLNPKDQVLLKVRRKHDTHGNVIEFQQLEPLLPIIHKRRYEYDKKGRYIVKEDIHMRTRELVEYDSTGNKRNIKIYRDSILLSEETTLTDSKGQILSSEYKSESAVFKHNYQYDSLGNIVEYIKVTNDLTDSTSSYRNEYQYDKQNNWIKRITKDLKGEPRNSVERTIVYY
jgi:hypothetical protein